MRNKISLKYYKLNELILLLIGVTCSRIMQFIRYKEKYLPIKQEIQELLEFNLKLTRKDEILYINHYPGFHEYIFRLRLNTSDRFVFKQIIVDEEYRPIIDIIKEHQDNESIRLIVDAGA